MAIKQCTVKTIHPNTILLVTIRLSLKTCNVRADFSTLLHCQSMALLVSLREKKNTHVKKKNAFLEKEENLTVSETNPPITYYWTVPLILDHSYLVEKLTRSKIDDTKVSGF